HYHPWNSEQGNSPFVWSVIGALSQATDLPVTTAVTCPIMRIHPAVIAQAAATASVQTHGTFRLGVGTGEALNEHVLGDRWPPIGVRLEMLEEAVAIIRALHTGEQTTHRGKYYTVEEAQLYTTPDQPVPVYVSGFGPQATRLAGRLGDGHCTATPRKELRDLFRAEGGGDNPVQAGMKVCYGPDAEAAAKTAHRLWGNQLVPGQLGQILPNPSDFEQATTQVTVDAVAGAMACGPDKQRYFDTVRSYLDAGVDELYIQQIGPDQEQFFEFWTEQLAGEF